MVNSELVGFNLYVDDLLLTGNNEDEIRNFKMFKKEFEMSDLSQLSYFPGMEFVQTSEGMFMHQKKYATDIMAVTFLKHQLTLVSSW